MTFRLNDDLFGVATAAVKEVTAQPPLTPIPHAPPEILGCVNLRGQIVLVADVNQLLQRGATAANAESRLVVFKPDVGDAFGILVEQVGDIVALTEEQIESPWAGTAGSGLEAGRPPQEELIRSVGKSDGQLLLILEARRLLPCLEQAVGRGAAADLARLHP